LELIIKIHPGDIVLLVSSGFFDCHLKIYLFMGTKPKATLSNMRKARN